MPIDDTSRPAPLPLPPAPPPQIAPPTKMPETGRRPGRRRRLVAVGVAVLVLAAAFGVYSFMGQPAYARASDALRAGRCGDAVAGFSRVTGFYRYGAGGKRSEARRGIGECDRFLAAQRIGAGDFAGTTAAYRAFLARYPQGPLPSIARTRMAVAYSGWGDQQVREGDYEGGIAKYATATQQFPGTAGASKASSSAARLLSEGRAKAPIDRTACTSVAILSALADDGLDAPDARRPLPTAYFHCARDEHRRSLDDEAKADLTTLIHGFRGSALVPKAKALLVDVRVAIYRAGDTGKLGQPQRIGTTTAGTVIVEIQNSSPDRLEILFSGPGSRSVIIGRCSSCQVYARGSEPAFCPNAGPTEQIALTPGTYDVVLHDPDKASTRDAFGLWTLESGAHYFNCQLLLKNPA